MLSLDNTHQFSFFQWDLTSYIFSANLPILSMIVHSICINQSFTNLSVSPLLRRASHCIAFIHTCICHFGL